MFKKIITRVIVGVLVAVALTFLGGSSASAASPFKQGVNFVFNSPDRSVQYARPNRLAMSVQNNLQSFGVNLANDFKINQGAVLNINFKFTVPTTNARILAYADQSNLFVRFAQCQAPLIDMDVNSGGSFVFLCGNSASPNNLTFKLTEWRYSAGTFAATLILPQMVDAITLGCSDSAPCIASVFMGTPNVSDPSFTCRSNVVLAPGFLRNCELGFFDAVSPLSSVGFSLDFGVFDPDAETAAAVDEQTQMTQEDKDNISNQDTSGNANADTTNLFSIMTNFVGAIVNTSSSDCSLNILGNAQIMPGMDMDLDFCQLEPPPFWSIAGAIICTVLLSLCSFAIVKQIINITDWARSTK